MDFGKILNSVTIPELETLSTTEEEKGKNIRKVSSGEMTIAGPAIGFKVSSESYNYISIPN